MGTYDYDPVAPAGGLPNNNAVYYQPGSYYAGAASQLGSKSQLGVPSLSDTDYNRLVMAYAGGGASAAGGLLGGGYNTTTSRGGASGGGRRSGGGGGAAAAPTMTQAQYDWIMGQLNGGRPAPQTATDINLPAYQNHPIAAFDGARYDQLQQAFDTAVGSDRQAAGTAYDNLDNYLQSNYRNAFASPQGMASMGNAPGASSDAMQRMLASQGYGDLGAPARADAQGADRAFGNLLGILGANENQAQSNRLRASQEDRLTTGRALDMASLQGTTAIGQQRASAHDAWQQRSDDRDYADAQAAQSQAVNQAMMNWQRQNTVADANTAAQSSFQNSYLSTLLSLLPQIIAAKGKVVPT